MHSTESFRVAVGAGAVADRPQGGERGHALPALAVCEVTKRWPSWRRPILEDVDLFLQAGSVTWLGGRNGVGKTTLLRIAAGLLAPDRGTVSVFETFGDLDRRSYQRQVGLLPGGNGSLYARLSVSQHLEYWCRLVLMERRDRGTAIERALHAFSLADLADRRTDRLSLGQRQRLRMALAFVHEPAVALLDEPRTSLDDDGVDTLLSAVRDLTDRGGAALWCSPAGDDHGGVSFDDAYVLENGQLQKA